jgi:hypothetical protein
MTIIRSMTRLPVRWVVLVAANAVMLCVLGLYRPAPVASQTPREPFANATAQRAEMVELLKQINAQLKEQNALLRSGELKVKTTPGER